MIGVIHAENFGNLHLDPADSAEQFPDLTALKLERSGVAHVLTDTSSAAPVGRAERRPTFCSAGLQLFDPAKGIPFFNLDDPDIRRFPRQQVGNKNGHPLVMTDALGALSEGIAEHFMDLILFQHVFLLK
jgi:hypothetical protein